ncbi:MAG: branched-chain amino acid ABC transporter permease [Burkholderiaceae bacterium]|nr:branched-chain amino acid ABC transporter permease [Burkholderiaceae bacterium]
MTTHPSSIQGGPVAGGAGLTGRVFGLLMLVVAATPFFLSSPFYIHLAILTCLNVVIVTGLSLIARTGQLSFGHGAFVGLGAYGSVIAGMQLGMPFWVAAVAGTVIACLCALALGWVILRLRGVYFVLVTFAFAELVRLVMLDWPGLTGGANGITGIPAAELFGFAFDTRHRFYGLALFCAVAALAFSLRLSRIPTGHGFDAVEQNASLAEASGLNVHRIQVRAFVIGCGIAGFAGALLAHYVGFVSPESFNLSLSISALVMLVIGGRYSVWGPLIGALILTPLPELFRAAVNTQHIFYGAALILILRFLPAGLASLPARLRRAAGRS